MDNKACCGNCKWRVHESKEDWICDNDNSAHYVDYVPWEHCCPQFKEKEGKKNYDWSAITDKRTGSRKKTRRRP